LYVKSLVLASIYKMILLHAFEKHATIYDRFARAVSDRVSDQSLTWMDEITWMSHWTHTRMRY